MRRRAVLAALAGLAVLASAGCTSSAGSSPSTPVSAADASPTSTASLPHDPGTPAAPSTAAPTIARLCPGAEADTAVARCLIASLNAFWTARLHRRVDGVAVLGFPDSFPPSCSFPKKYLAIHARTAFECPVNHTLYFGPVFLRHLHQDDPADGFPERLAATMGHEEGHLVQDTVHQRQPDNVSPDAGSRFIEQQADCLSGVWADGIGLRPDAFLAAARAMLTDVDDAEHRRDHGTVDQRMAAIRRGLTGVAACRLAKP